MTPRITNHPKGVDHHNARLNPDTVRAITAENQLTTAREASARWERLVQLLADALKTISDTSINGPDQAYLRQIARDCLAATVSEQGATIAITGHDPRRISPSSP